MDESLVIEGTVVDDHGQSFLQTAPPEGNTTSGYYGENLLEEYVGKRIRVTVEIIK